ncbi:TPA: restriction endonuclease subunit S [Salmonella enterica]
MSSNYREQWTSVGGHFPSHWQFFKLEELLENTKGIAIGVMYPGDHTAEGIPLIKVGDVKDGYIASQPSFFISPEVDEEYKRTRLNGTELLITLVGNPGDCVVVEPYMAGWNAARALAVVRLKDTGLREWLKYILLSKPAKHLIDARLNTTVQKTLNLKDIRELGIPIPPKHERDMIIKNISAIEQKKIVNSDTNQTLEQMAQALFKSWFVDFEPVKAKIAVLEAGGSQEDATLAAMTAISGKDADALAVFEREHPEQYAELKATAELFPSAMQDSELGKIPEGWNFLPLESVTSMIIDHRGKTPKKLGGDWSEDGYPAISAKNIKNGRLVRHDTIKYVNPEMYTKWMKDVLLSGDILMTSEAPLGELLYLAKDSDYLLSQRLYGIRANNVVSGCYLYLWLQSANAKADISGRATGSTVVGIRQSELKKVNVLVPKKALIESFSSLAAYYLAKIESNEKQNIALENLRDTLLPKLLSGEITLPEAEQIISEEA